MWRVKRALKISTVSAALFGGTALVIKHQYDKSLAAQCKVEDINLQLNDKLPSRAAHIQTVKEQVMDVLVIGGGATGAGCTLDAVSRGLSVAVVEKFDFSSGTSSRSTKLIHGGVRYLQKAIMQFDYEQYRMVREALAERANLLEIAPHLAYKCPIMLPVYKRWQIPYFWAGIKAYDIVAGSRKLEWSYYLPKRKAIELFPMLKSDELVGAIVYYDGQHEDARMGLSLVMTAARLGACTLNYTEVISLLHEEVNGMQRVCGARVRDKATGEEFDIRAKCVINATGAYTDVIRMMSGEKLPKICQPSSGTHIVLPSYYSPEKMGLLDPSTSDGRVIFFLPWQGSTIAGTTDRKCELTDNPSPSEADVQFILDEIRHYLSPDVNVRRGDVMSCWTGLRPLVVDPKKIDTQSLARNHIIEVSNDKLVTIAGGKWTTYRSMAEETLDTAIEVCQLTPTRKCQTKGLLLDGAHNWSQNMHIRLVQDFGLDVKVAEHLSRTYGDRADKVAKFAQMTGLAWPVMGRRLHPEFPYIEAEVIWAVRVEYARRALDILARRTRLAFLNVTAAAEALPKIVEIMGKELGWTPKQCAEEEEYCRKFLCKEMGLDLKQTNPAAHLQLSKDEINLYVKRFQRIDIDKKGYITVNDLRRHMKEMGQKLSEDQVNDMLNEVDVNKNGRIDMPEFLQLMASVKGGTVTHSRFALATRLEDDKERTAGVKMPPERSGGGV